MVKWDMLSVFIIVFAGVTILGFWAARWRQGDLNRLQEWGLAGRRFGTIVSWLLLGGDIYTAYSFVAVPGLVFASGIIGFYAVPYATIAYPIAFLVLSKYWTVARHRGYVTPADFVRDRFDSRSLTLLVAITGILATMPYMALQIYGMEVSIAQMGISVEASLIIAFLCLAAYTYTGGLRAPAMIAIVKDISIWIVVLVAVIYIPIKLGGYGYVFQQVHENALKHPKTFHDVLTPSEYSVYISLAVGSALALFLFPHNLTGVLSANSRKAVQRNAALLPAYTFLLGLLCLLGFIAIAAGIETSPIYKSNIALPALFAKEFPGWFAGFSFAAISIGALTPASIMSIAAANLFTRNIYREHFRPNCSEREEANTAKTSSLVVKVGALSFILFFPTTLAINLQLLSNIWIVQILPAVFLGLYTNWFHRRALTIGLLGGLLTGTWMIVAQNFASSVFPISIGALKLPLYAGVPALIVNLLLCCSLTPIFRIFGVSSGQDHTTSADFEPRPVRNRLLVPLNTGS